MNRFLFIALSIFTCTNLSAKKDLTHFWSDKDAILNAQTELTLDLVNEILDVEKPSVETPGQARKAALYLMDQILHDTRLDGSPLVAAFLNERINTVANDLKHPVDHGVKVYKLYNDGWILKTPSVTIGWDIYRGPMIKDSESHYISDSVAAKLVEECDIMFLTHNHLDHVDPFVVDLFTTAGKPVVAPDEILANNPKVTHTRKENIWKEDFVAANGVTLKSTIIPGHQDHLQNNIFIVTTPEGYNVCSTGDQYLSDDLDMIMNLKGKVPAVDILLPICWAVRLPEMCTSFGAKVVLTGHENELGHHSIDHREAYWLSYNKLEDFPVDNSLMTWGECFYYDK